MSQTTEKQPEIGIAQQSLRDKLTQIRNAKKMKNNELAALAGCSEGTLSDLINNKKSFSDKLINSITARVGNHSVSGNLVTSLRQYQQIWNLAEACKKASDMRLIVGNTGIGKSTVLRQYAAQASNVYYYKADRRLTWGKLLLAINECMGIVYKKRSTNDLFNNIIRKVEETADSNPLLIIDESEVLSNTIYKHIKNLNTATDGLLAIAIIGITEVKDRIAKLAGLDTQTWQPLQTDSNCYTTFARRLKIHRIPNIGFKPDGNHDIDDYCAAKGIANRDVIKAARTKWWNYDIAEKDVQRARGFGFDLANMTIDEFNLL
ncbi:MAG: AAA family ATPase [Prolixibacteraceae bacterium]|nr:AAA family ATPase [Prolixibacteraceae bacterium]